MLLDLRTYRCRPGTIGTHLKLYEEFGKEPQFRCLGTPLCYLKTETGNANEYVHIWVYENAGDREAKRKVLWSDPDWLDYTKKSAELGALESQTNKLMTPVDFCPLKAADAG
ncbi:MAG: NIPSNAP family protein [Pseudomonadota bacterium]